MKWVVVLVMVASTVFASDVVIDLSKAQVPLSYGAVGSHYALSEPDVPSVLSLIPIRVRTVNQKAPEGLQHPGADAFRVLESFVTAGGEYLQVYLQDIYQSWPYEKNPDLDGDAIPDDYLEKLRTAVQKMETSPYRDRIVYVPFNEPDAIWYNGLFWSRKRQEEFFKAWKKVYQEIKKIAPNARIAGPNTTTYNARFMRTFLEFCKKEGCIPHLITWHELNILDLEAGHAYYLDYRRIEKELGIDPIPVCVNEYAVGKQLSVPGRLVSWLARFEQSGIDGCLAYWHVAGNFSGLVEGNEPNGAWWLFRVYASMRGKLVEAHPSYRSVSYLVTVDEETETVQILLGGRDEESLVVTLQNLPEFFREKAYYEVWEIEWSGYTGLSLGPDLLTSGTIRVENGQCRLELKNLKEMSAYFVILKSEIGSERRTVWKMRVEAEDGNAVNCTRLSEGGGNNPPFSGGKVVFLSRPNSKLSFEIEVPEEGIYLLEIWYVNGRRNSTVYNLRIDDQVFKQIFPSTITVDYVGKVGRYVHLARGKHVVEIFGDEDAMPVGIDLIGVKLVSEREGEPRSVPVFPFFNVMTAGEVRYEGNRLMLGKGASVEFVLVVEEDGYYRLTLDTGEQAGLRLVLNRKVSTILEDSRITVFLQKGLNLVKIINPSERELTVGSLKVEIDREHSDLLNAYEAENGKLHGSVKEAESIFASGGWMVEGIGMGAANYLEMDLHIPVDGSYAVVLRYSNGETLGTHQYNVNVVDRYAKIEIGGETLDVFFRFTGGFDSFKTKTLYLSLKGGKQTIRIFNTYTVLSPALPSPHAPHIDTILVAPVFVE